MQGDFEEIGAEKQKNVSTEMIKCPACGGNMVFDPETQMLYCPHCDTKQTFKQSFGAKEIDILQGFDDNRKWGKEEAVCFRCDNCGAKVVLNKGETAKGCPFCGTAHVQKVEELDGLKPNALLPFLFGIEKAVNIVKNWAKKKLYAPSDFKTNLKTEKVKGVYTPCFTFDSKTTSRYVGRIGDYHTRVVGSGKNRRTETYVVWRNISGTYYEGFDDVLITAGSKFDQQKLNKISPYQTCGAREYDENYMLGFMAYHYDKEITDCWAEAKRTMDSVIKKEILSQYHYDVLSYINVSTSHEAVTYKYVMLPVYVGHFDYKKKLYNFYVNGTSGKVLGKTPVSALKVLATVGISLAAIGLIGLLVYLINR